MPATTRGEYVSNCAELRSQALFERSHGCEGLSVRRRHVSYGSGTSGSANARKAAAQNFVRSHSPARGFLRRIIVRERIQADAAAVFVTIVQFFLPPLLQTFSHVFRRAPGRRLRRRSRLVFFFLLRDHKAHRTRDQRLHGFSHFHRLHAAAPTARERSSVTATSFLRRFPGASFVSFSRRAAPVTPPNPSRTYLPCASLVRLRCFRVCFEGASSTMPFFWRVLRWFASPVAVRENRFEPGTKGGYDRDRLPMERETDRAQTRRDAGREMCGVRRGGPEITWGG